MRLYYASKEPLRRNVCSFLRQSLRSTSPFAFLGNKSVMQHTHCDASIRECRRSTALHKWRQRRDGFAPWAARLRKTEWTIGWGGHLQCFVGPRLEHRTCVLLDSTAWGWQVDWRCFEGNTCLDLNRQKCCFLVCSLSFWCKPRILQPFENKVRIDRVTSYHLRH